MTLAGVAAIAVIVLPLAGATNGASPAPVLTAISAGGGHTCAITSAGGVKCWGSNRYGQLGNGAPRKCNSFGRCAQPFSNTPADVVGLTTGVKAVAAGGSHTCALTRGGGVKCWGYNASGQLGNGARLRDCSLGSCERYASSTPVDVVGLGSGVRAIAAGDFHSCAITAVRGVKCWGSNTNGQLGNDSGEASSTPVDVVGLGAGVKAITAGAQLTCAITSGGGVTCWGYTPAAVPGLAAGVTATALADGTSAGTGGEHACALTSGGGVKCWERRGTPTDVVGLGSGVRAITAGADYSCAITVAGGAKCWGGNYFGTLGNGSRTQSGTPVGVAGLTSGVIAISAGPYHACAIVSGGGITCWGFNQSGRLGNASAPRIATKPVGVRFSAQPTAKSPGTAPASPNTADGCSKAAATAVVERLHLGAADFMAKPVWAVLCGSVMGPGSKTMVVSLATGGTSVPFGGWVVFRLAGGRWQLVFQQRNGAEVSAAGSGIRETVGISRPGDPRCCPSGGSRSRVWRWNGARFTAGTWRRTRPPTATAPTQSVVTSGHFKTPSGNIVCQYFFAANGPSRKQRSAVHCGIHSGLKPAPPRRPCAEGGYAGDRVSLGTTGRVDVPACAGDPGAFVGEESARVLAYGATLSGGGLRCSSAETGLTCRNTSGHGFFLSRERWRSF